MKDMETNSRKFPEQTSIFTEEELKGQIQSKAVFLSTVYPILILEHATGVGKSLSAIRIIENHKGKWTIMVAETSHINNWINEFKKHGKEYLLDDITFSCYASWHKHLKEENYILDECHNALNSEIRLAYLREVSKNCKKIVALTATLSQKLKGNFTSIFPNAFFYKIPLDLAIDNKILPEPKIYLIGVELSNGDKVIPFKKSKSYSILCSEQEWYNRQEELIEYRKNVFFRDRAEWSKLRWLEAGSERKRFLANVKTKYAAKLLDKFKDKKLICFTHTIKQSEELSKGYSIHSKVAKELREGMIKDFNEGKITKLFTTKMLREGMNLEGIEVGIIVQLDNNTKSFYQTIGRVLRSQFPEYYIIYVKDTQDEVYVRNALQGFNPNYLINTSLEELLKG